MAKVKRITIIIVLVVIAIIVLLLTIRFVNQYLIKNEAKKLVANGGISELVELDVNGTKQFLLIEGKEKKKPILLFLHGGPGQPFPFGVSARGAFPQITEDFIAVYYDQRGSGKSYSKDIPLETMNINQFVQDTDVVVNFLLEKFKRDKVFIVGMSWGTIIGTKYSSVYPEKVDTYIGISQFIDNKETQKRANVWLTEIAQNQEEQKMLNDLNSLNAPPYTGKEDTLLSNYISKYGGDNYSDEKVKKANIFGLLKWSLISPDYTLVDLNKAMVSGASFSLKEAKDLQNEINQVNFSEEIHSLQMPVYIFQGVHDKVTNYELTKEFIDKLAAPAGKELIPLLESAHYPNDEDFKVIYSKLKEISANKGS
ncbi:alpha/beta hydrolase [Lysinibacillus antri]|uniref:prolyl aminopeptidase n=1 Tax=Lysinibacillus antri TaxID=2498145 RepID=A0A432LGZ0_9BACI|nr:alpha/beta hydrolase [Lysinibacillus antri]RUL55624.1 alpha/beta hydrolase [Lysinibacillus antri]